MDSGKVVVLTGNGKGKTTSALGMGLDGWANGKKVLFLQFIKGGRTYGELSSVGSLGDSFKIKQTGLGFVRNVDKETFKVHKKHASKALEEALVEIKTNNFNIIVLDEINYAVYYNLLSEDDVLGVIKQKPSDVQLILTGRYAPGKVVEQADEVYEFKEVKHYASNGIMARQGIEY